MGNDSTMNRSQQYYQSKTQQPAFKLKLHASLAPPNTTLNTSSDDKENSKATGNMNSPRGDDDFKNAETFSEQDEKAKLEKMLWRQHYVRVCFHALIPVYGLFVILLQFL